MFFHISFFVQITVVWNRTEKECFFWAEASYPHCDKKQHLEQGSQHYYKLWMLITPVHLINNTDMVLRSYVSCGCQTHWPWCQVWLYLPFSPLSYSQNPPPPHSKKKIWTFSFRPNLHLSLISQLSYQENCNEGQNRRICRDGRKLGVRRKCTSFIDGMKFP